MPKRGKKRKVPVLVSAREGVDLGELAGHLHAAGLEVERTMEEARVVLGSIEEEVFPALSQVPGVWYVEQARPQRPPGRRSKPLPGR